MSVSASVCVCVCMYVSQRVCMVLVDMSNSSNEGEQKPCRACTDFKSWMRETKKSTVRPGKVCHVDMYYTFNNMILD